VGSLNGNYSARKDALQKKYSNVYREGRKEVRDVENCAGQNAQKKGFTK
jgi:hypothetical protein